MNNSCQRHNESCRIHHCLAIETLGDGFILILEDIDHSGYSDRRGSFSWNEVEVCLSWLANFHATFMNHRSVLSASDQKMAELFTNR